MTSTARLRNWLAPGLLALAALVVPVLAHADDDPPGRAGRIAEMQGDVSSYDEEEGRWVPAVRNRPLTGGDRIATEDNGRLEIRVGSTTLRLGPGSELEVLRLDDERLKFQLHSGSLALRVRTRDVADEIEIVTDEARLRPQRTGHYRIDRRDDSTYVAVWRGTMRVEDRDDSFGVETGRRAEIWREGSDRRLQRAWTSIPDDEFGDWVLAEDRRDDRSVSRRYVSPEMTGAEDLDRYGRWEQHPEYGAIWTPIVVSVGWAPYRHGRWVWVRPWGWTWVDEAPWGFAPFHYGRWVYYRERWCWTPGTYVARPVYAPALVAWVGGANFSVSVSIGGPALPAVGWVPLAPREIFVPYYRHSTVYVERVNHHPRGRPLPPSQPIMYGNQAVPNAVTVVPRDVLVQRQPVARAVVDLRDQPNNRPLPIVRGSQPVAPPPRAESPAVTPPLQGRPIKSLPITRPGSPPPVLSIPREETPSRTAPPVRRDENPVRVGPREDTPVRPVAPVRRDDGEGRAPMPQRGEVAPAPSKAPEVNDLRQRGDAERQRREAQERQTQERQAAERQAQQERAARERQQQEQREAAERAQREQRRETPRAPAVVERVQPAPQPVQRPPQRPERDERERNEPRNEPRNPSRDANLR